MIIIPARLESTRFPRKILADINGLPMVVATAKRVETLDDVAVATDSKEVLDICQNYDIKAVLTDKNHQSGTDRINEASKILDLHEDEIVVNVQGDEPFIETDVVKAVIDKTHSDENAFMVSCYKEVSDADDPNLVKVVVDINGYALYFSRSKIPYDRAPCESYFGHLGIYGFRRKNLEQFCSFPPAPLENIEKLEQLRALYNGKKIAMVKVKSESIGIDTKEDLENALATFKKV